MDKASFFIAPFLTFVVAICIADGQVATNNPASATSRKEMQTIGKAFRQQEQQDAAGLSEYESNKEDELRKFERGPQSTVDSDATKLAESLALLSALPNPDVFSNATERAQLDIERTREQLMNTQVIPVWTGRAWIDGISLACNGFECSRNVKKNLSSLNFWDRYNRQQSIHGDTTLGKALGTTRLARWSLLESGYEVKFDKTFGIWRITGTNAPATKSP